MKIPSREECVRCGTNDPDCDMGTDHRNISRNFHVLRKNWRIRLFESSTWQLLAIVESGKL